MPQATAEGGAVAATGALTLTATRITGSAAVSGQGIPGVDAAAGGAAFGARHVTVVGSLLAGNTSGRGRADVLGGRGGAVAGTDVVLRATRLTGNTAAGDGGAVAATSMTASRTTFTGNVGGRRGGAVAVTGDASITDGLVRHNVVAGEFLRCICAPDDAAAGAGLHAGSSLTLLRTEVSDNSGEVRFQVGTLAAGAGLFRGGGVDAASLLARDSTIAGNTIRGNEYAEAADWSGRAAGGGVAAGSAVLTNTTVSGNTVRNAIRPDAPQDVARAAAVSTGALVLDHATMTRNTLYRFDFTTNDYERATGPAAATLTAAPLRFDRSVVLPATGQVTCGTGTVAAASSYSVAGDPSCDLAGPGDRQSAAGAGLGPPGRHGGPVPTQVPTTGSVLVDAVPPDACPVRADARGVRRPQGPACDVGAVEVVPR
jgi:predicted outer membrane repeat protein